MLGNLARWRARAEAHRDGQPQARPDARLHEPTKLGEVWRCQPCGKQGRLLKDLGFLCGTPQGPEAQAGLPRGDIRRFFGGERHVQAGHQHVVQLD